MKEPSFESYANFGKRESTLPLKEHETVTNPEGSVNQGGFTSVIEIDDGKKVAKINRLLDYSPEEESIRLGAYEEEDFLAESSGNKKLDREAAAEKMVAFAEYKREIYEQLGKYIPEHLPEIYGFAVVDSPRRELEKRLKKSMGMKLTQEQAERIPTQEVALMEVWENVSPETSLSARNYEELSALSEDPTFTREMQNFANGTLSLVREQGIMIDICDYGGIRAIGKNGEHIKIDDPEDIVRLLKGEEDALAYPRNTTYKESKLKFFDTYPINNITELTEDKEFLDNVVNVLQEEEYERLAELAGDQGSEEGKNKRQVIQYLALLKYIGADFEKSQEKEE